MTKLFNKGEYTKKRRTLRREMPKAEKLLWQHIRNVQLGYKFRRQYGIGAYTADFYCPKLKVCVEVDGLSHWTEEAKKHDKKRDAYFKTLGIRVLRYSRNEVWHELDSVKQDILNTCDQLRTKGGFD